MHYACTEIRIKCFDITVPIHTLHKATEECHSHAMLHGTWFDAHSSLLAIEVKRIT